MIALYDGNCTLCKQTKRFFQGLDQHAKVEWVSLQEYETENIHTFDAAELRKELHIILANGTVLKGYFAVRKLFVQLPLTMFLGWFMYIPFLSIIGQPIYRWVARNRHKWLRKKCDNGGCSL